MTNNSIYLKLLFLIIISSQMSCVTETPNKSTQNSELYSTPSFEKLGAVPEYFEILNISDTTIEGSKGTKISIPKGCLGDLNKKYRIEMTEYYSISDMILRNLTTSSKSNKILETDGMIEIIIKDSNNVQVEQLIHENGIFIEMPKTKNNMKLFFGIEKNNTVLWQEENSKKIYNLGNISSEFLENYNRFHIDKLSNWINADKFLQYENKTDLIVQLPKDQKGAAYSLTFYNYNSILPGIPNNKGELVFKGIPTGEKVTLLGMGSKEETLYYSSLNLTTDTKNAQLPKLKEITKEALQAELESKFGNSLADRPRPMF